MKVGCASSIITPPVDVRLSGYASKVQPSEDVHDDLMCRALYFEDGSKVFVIIVLDVIRIDLNSWNIFGT